ncbi:general odorant-binding protein 70 [Eurosta solidaginis]|uniref:general odorant-binding protein 70 n=1 Tax=Eurosta solidaginis TaxID=178769 RepID=UPI0035310FA4
MIKQDVYRGYQQLDANDDSLQLMSDHSSVLSAEHDITGSGSGDAVATAPSQIDEKVYDLPAGYDPHHNDYSRRQVKRLLHRIRRIAYDSHSTIYHPTLVPFEDKRIAGCLLHCVYAKNNAIDKLGWPTLDGLVEFYSEGVNEHGFFMATLRSVNLCLRAVTIKYRVNRRKLPESGESCDLAFDVFDCISDQITGYCLDQYK